MTDTTWIWHHHNHQDCVASALQRAQSLCQRNGARLTPLRHRVLELIWQSHKPLGAYELINQLGAETTRNVAPPTVYRALDFLQRQGLVHRIATLNAFIGCDADENGEHGYFFICRVCHTALELAVPTIAGAIDDAADATGFSAEGATIEVLGQCPSCRATEPAHG